MRPSEIDNYYKRLGVSEYSSKNEIKSAFRKLVMQWHPDRCDDPKADEEFASVIEAYRGIEISDDCIKNEIMDLNLKYETSLSIDPFTESPQLKNIRKQRDKWIDERRYEINNMKHLRMEDENRLSYIINDMKKKRNK